MWDAGRPCLLCEYAYAELQVSVDGRVVTYNEHWMAVVPWWATWPYELLCKCDLQWKLNPLTIFGIYPPQYCRINATLNHSYTWHQRKSFHLRNCCQILQYDTTIYFLALSPIQWVFINDQYPYHMTRRQSKIIWTWLICTLTSLPLYYAALMWRNFL